MVFTILPFIEPRRDEVAIGKLPGSEFKVFCAMRILILAWQVVVFIFKDGIKLKTKERHVTIFPTAFQYKTEQ